MTALLTPFDKITALSQGRSDIALTAYDARVLLNLFDYVERMHTALGQEPDDGLLCEQHNQTRLLVWAMRGYGMPTTFAEGTTV